MNGFIMRKNSLGVDHYNIAISYLNLGKCYKKLKIKRM